MAARMRPSRAIISWSRALPRSRSARSYHGTELVVRVSVVVVRWSLFVVRAAGVLARVTGFIARAPAVVGCVAGVLWRMNAGHRS